MEEKIGLLMLNMKSHGRAQIILIQFELNIQLMAVPHILKLSTQQQMMDHIRGLSHSHYPIFVWLELLDATDSDPFDISDAVFSNSTKTTASSGIQTSPVPGLCARQYLMRIQILGYDTIIFKIHGTGIHTIQPLTELPTITDPVLIDGYTQPGQHTKFESNNIRQ